MEPKLPVKAEVGTVDSSTDEISNTLHSPKVFVLADLNVNPPETDGEPSAPDLSKYFHSFTLPRNISNV